MVDNSDPLNQLLCARRLGKRALHSGKYLVVQLQPARVVLLGIDKANQGAVARLDRAALVERQHQRAMQVGVLHVGEEQAAPTLVWLFAPLRLADGAGVVAHVFDEGRLN